MEGPLVAVLNVFIYICYQILSNQKQNRKQQREPIRRSYRPPTTRSHRDPRQAAPLARPAVAADRRTSKRAPQGRTSLVVACPAARAGARQAVVCPASTCW